MNDQRIERVLALLIEITPEERGLFLREVISALAKIMTEEAKRHLSALESLPKV